MKNNKGVDKREHEAEREQPLSGYNLPVTEENLYFKISEVLRQSLEAMSPDEFEEFVAHLLRELGYRDVKKVGGRGDEGIDIKARFPLAELVEEDIAIQCKHYRERNITSRHIREFIGALQNARIKKGIFITTGDFTRDAKDAAKKGDLTLVNGDMLVEIILRNIKVLEEWEDGNGPPPPPPPAGKIRFKILKEEFSANRWNEILWVTAEWLIKQGKLNPEDAPISAGRKRYLVNAEPAHPTGRLFVSPKKLSNGLFVELNYSADRCVAMAKKLLEWAGMDEKDLTVLE